MAGKRGVIPEDLDCSTANVCAIVGNFTPQGVDIVYRNLQANVLNFERLILAHKKKTAKKELVKRGKYVRQER